MLVKFIIADDQVIFGKLYYKDDLHAKVAKAHEISKDRIRGGGIADLVNQRIFGKSYDFGPYNVETVQRLLGWQWKIDPPSDYK